MRIQQVAAQLYTLRDFLKTPADMAATLKKVRKIGYQAVQLSGMGPIDEAELVKMLKGEGLVCCATHESGDKILKETDWVIDRLNKLGCRYTAYPYPGGFKFETMEEVDRLADGLHAAGKAMAAAGQVLTYHNHDIEFMKLEGKTILEHLYDKTAPAYLQGEPDTYWVAMGGQDPVAWCDKLAGRLPLLHMKDFRVNLGQRAAMAEIGNGTLDWPSIVAVAEDGGCEWFIVEQDAFWMDNDPFKSLEISFRYIQENLVCG